MVQNVIKAWTGNIAVRRCFRKNAPFKVHHETHVLKAMYRPIEGQTRGKLVIFSINNGFTHFAAVLSSKSRCT